MQDEMTAELGEQATLYYQLALDIYRVIQDAINIRNACESVYEQIASILGIQKFFCVMPTVTTNQATNFKIDYCSFIVKGQQVIHSPRRLGPNEILRQIFIWGTVISSEDATKSTRELGFELCENGTWILVPMICSSGQVLGALGFCRGENKAFSEREKFVLNTVGVALMQFIVIHNNIKRIKEEERRLVIGELVANLLHEIRNDFGTIPIHIQFIEDELKKADLKYPSIIDHQLQEIDQEARVIEAKTIERMSEIKKALSAPDAEYIDIGQLVYEVIESLGEVTQYKLSIDIQPALPRVAGYKRNLFDATRNIIQNGLQAMANSVTKELRILVKDWQDGNNKTWVQIGIKDSGIGINSEDLSKIWLLSYSTRSDVGGFGLYWARRVLEEIGGFIDVHSRVNEGTEFTINLPGATN
jgi:signal transduction histidine kinase